MQALFNRDALALNRDKACFSFHNHNFLHNFAAKDLLVRLDLLKRTPQNILELGARDGILTNLLIDQYPKAKLKVTESSSMMLSGNPALDKTHISDEEYIQNVKYAPDLIISLLNIHWVNDIQAYMQNISNSLSDDGIFVANFWGVKTLSNLKHRMLIIEDELAAGHKPHIIPFLKQENIYKLMQRSGFNFVIVDSEEIVVEYQNIINLITDLRAMAETNILSNNIYYPGKKFYHTLMEVENFTEIFEIVTITAAKRKIEFKY